MKHVLSEKKEREYGVLSVIDTNLRQKVFHRRNRIEVFFLAHSCAKGEQLITTSSRQWFVRIRNLKKEVKFRKEHFSPTFELSNYNFRIRLSYVKILLSFAILELTTLSKTDWISRVSNCVVFRGWKILIEKVTEEVKSIYFSNCEHRAGYVNHKFQICILRSARI